MNRNHNKIWWQSSTALEHLPVLEKYSQSLKTHAEHILAPSFQIEIKGVRQPNFDIHYWYLEHLNNIEMIENLYKAHRDGYAAIVIGCFLDSGLREARTFSDVPVLGMAETAMLTSCMLGRQFSIVTYNPGLADKKFPQLIREYGLEKRSGPFGCMNVSLQDLAKAFDEPQPLIKEFVAISEDLVDRGTDIILPGCGLLNMVLVANRITHIAQGKVPVVDVVGVLLQQAESMIKLQRSSNLTVSRSGYYEIPPNIAEIRSLYSLG
jgi:Asp/Glu/hydantoin racemase